MSASRSTAASTGFTQGLTLLCRALLRAGARRVAVEDPCFGRHRRAPDRVVYIGGASKTLTPALRLGWVAAPEYLMRSLECEKRYDDMGSGLLEQLAFARFVERGDFSRHLRRVRLIYRRRRDATISALSELLPAVRWQGASGGLHLHVLLPAGSDERAITVAAYERGALVEDAAWYWARPQEAPPSLMLGYGALGEPLIRRAIAIVADAMAATAA